jgi:hypothetical protein
MSLQPLFQWMQAQPFAAFFLESIWPTPIVQCIHLISVAVFAGALLIVDLRLLGRGLTSSLKEYYSPFFWWKMEMVFLGAIVTFVVRKRIASKEEGHFGPVWPKVVGITSIALWTSVTIGARLIGLLS